jgi:hypothetical protein
VPDAARSPKSTTKQEELEGFTASIFLPIVPSSSKLSGALCALCEPFAILALSVLF